MESKIDCSQLFGCTLSIKGGLIEEIDGRITLQCDALCGNEELDGNRYVCCLLCQKPASYCNIHAVVDPIRHLKVISLVAKYRKNSIV